MGLRPLAIASAWVVLIAVAFASSAAAGPMGSLTSTGATPGYNVTDLGNYVTFTNAADGSTTAVTGANGQTFAFDKYPVMSVDSSRLYNGGGSNGNYWWDPVAMTSTDMFVIASNRFGSIGYGSVYQPYPNYDYWARAVFRYPSGAERDLGWATVDHSIQPPPSVINYTRPIPAVPPPDPSTLTRDFNTSGEVVGSNQYQAILSKPTSPDGIAFNRNLGDEIAAELASRINLTSGLHVDDLGRIIAEGQTTNGDIHDYLLTPTDLPSPAPEPSTLAILGFALAGWAVRTQMRSKKVIHS